LTSPPAVAVTGLGALCATGLDVTSCTDALFGPRRRPAPSTRFSSEHATVYPVFELPAAFWETSHGQGPESLSLTARLALAVAGQAFGQAGWTPEMLAREGIRAGVCIGTTVGAAMNDEAFYRAYRAGQNPDMAAIERYLASNPAAVVATTFGLAGPRQTVANACCSGADAIGIGASWIRAGLCDLVLAGGADELCRFTYNGFISLMITDAAPCRPFDATRKGLNLGEGAGAVVLESEALRQRRGAPAQGYVLGYGTSCDAHHLTAPHPQGAGLKRALAQSLAQVRASDVAFVNAHGTGTADNDRVEALVMAEMLPGVPFISTKGHTGHTLGAAGAIEAVLTLACLARGKLPASAGYATPDREHPAHPSQANVSFAARTALSFSLAFGGANAVLALGLDP